MGKFALRFSRSLHLSCFQPREGTRMTEESRRFERRTYVIGVISLLITGLGVWIAWLQLQQGQATGPTSGTGAGPSSRSPAAFDKADSSPSSPQSSQPSSDPPPSQATQPETDWTEADLAGKWRWRESDERSLVFDLNEDGTFIADDYPTGAAAKQGAVLGLRLVGRGKGEWWVKDNRLTIRMTHLSLKLFWKEHKVFWIENALIRTVVPGKRVELHDLNPLLKSD